MSVRREVRIIKHKPVSVEGYENPNIAASIDYGQHGLGIVTILKLKPGDFLRVTCPDFWPETRDAVVVWVEPLSKTSIRAGLTLH